MSLVEAVRNGLWDISRIDYVKELRGVKQPTLMLLDRMLKDSIYQKLKNSEGLSREIRVLSGIVGYYASADSINFYLPNASVSIYSVRTSFVDRVLKAESVSELKARKDELGKLGDVPDVLKLEVRLYGRKGFEELGRVVLVVRWLLSVLRRLERVRKVRRVIKHWVKVFVEELHKELARVRKPRARKVFVSVFKAMDRAFSMVLTSFSVGG